MKGNRERVCVCVCVRESQVLDSEAVRILFPVQSTNNIKYITLTTELQEMD